MTISGWLSLETRSITFAAATVPTARILIFHLGRLANSFLTQCGRRKKSTKLLIINTSYMYFKDTMMT